jgi:hypothetical protein
MMMGRFSTTSAILAVLGTPHLVAVVDAFTSRLNPWGIGVSHRNNRQIPYDNAATTSQHTVTTTKLCVSFRPVPSDQEGVPIPFVDVHGRSFIECYADAIAEVDGIEYTIGVPCDYAVALCYFDEDQQLVPIELSDPLMDDVYPIAESIVEEEFGEELVRSIS